MNSTPHTLSVAVLLGFFVVIAQLHMAKSHAAGKAANATASPIADSSFGTNGQLAEHFPGSDDDALRSVAAYPNGDIVGVGRSGTYTFAICKYLPNGAPDTSFNTNGKLRFNITQPGGLAHAVSLDAQSNIVVVGKTPNSTKPSSVSDFAVARILPTGSLDTTFNGSGYATLSATASGDDVANAVAIQADGKILVSGYTTVQNGVFVIDVVRFNSNGSPDTAFNANVQGQLNGPHGLFPLSSNPAVGSTAIAIQPDGTIVLAVNVTNNGAYHFGCVRLLNNGMLDISFGPNSNGFVDFGPMAGSSEDTTYSVSVQGDGKLVFGGRSKDANGIYRLAVLRCSANGTIDTSFGQSGAGYVCINGFGTTIRDNYGPKAVVLPSGPIVIGGPVAGSGGSEVFGVAVVGPNGQGSTIASLPPFAGSISPAVDVPVTTVCQFGMALMAGRSADAVGKYRFAIARVIP